MNVPPIFATDDLTGHVLEHETWEHVRFAAIAVEDEEHHYSTPAGPRVFRRRKGDLLLPEREPQHILDTHKLRMGSYDFAGQYQQSPAPQGGELVKAEWFKRYTTADKPEHFDRVVQSWDTATTLGPASAFSIVTAGKMGLFSP
jgi:hypothetical protein